MGYSLRSFPNHVVVRSKFRSRNSRCLLHIITHMPIHNAHTHTHAHTHTRTHAHTYTYTHAHTHTHTCSHKHMLTNTPYVAQACAPLFIQASAAGPYDINGLAGRCVILQRNLSDPLQLTTGTWFWRRPCRVQAVYSMEWRRVIFHQALYHLYDFTRSLTHTLQSYSGSGV